MSDINKAIEDAQNAEREKAIQDAINDWKTEYVKERAGDNTGSYGELPGEDISTPEGRRQIKERIQRETDRARGAIKAHTTNAYNDALNRQIASEYETRTINGETYTKVDDRWLDSNGCDQTENMP